MSRALRWVCDKFWVSVRQRLTRPACGGVPSSRRTSRRGGRSAPRARGWRRQFAQQPPRHRRVALRVVLRALDRREVPRRTRRRPHPAFAVRLDHPDRADLGLPRRRAPVLPLPPRRLRRQRGNPRAVQSNARNPSFPQRPANRRPSNDASFHASPSPPTTVIDPDSHSVRHRSRSSPTSRVVRSTRFAPKFTPATTFSSRSASPQQHADPSSLAIRRAVGVIDPSTSRRDARGRALFPQDRQT